MTDIRPSRIIPLHEMLDRSLGVELNGQAEVGYILQMLVLKVKELEMREESMRERIVWLEAEVLRRHQPKVTVGQEQNDKPMDLPF